MPPTFNKPFFHVVDVETTGLSEGHARTGLLQLYATGLPQYQDARPFDPRTFIKPSRGYKDPRTGNFIQFNFNFSQGQDVLQSARNVGAMSEEEAAGGFFRAASAELAAKRRFLLAGWNPTYDTGVLEALTKRYASLNQYSGFFQRPGVKTFSLEQPFLEFAQMYGQANPEFAARHFRMGPSAPITREIGPGVQARNVAEMRYVGGWSVENITKAAGGRERLIGAVGQFHEAVTDVTLEKQLFEKFRLAKKTIARGYSFDIALATAGVLPEGQTAEGFFKQIFSSSWSGYIAKQAERGVAIKPPVPNQFAGAATKVLLVASAATAAYAIATSKRKDRQTQITGLQDIGYAARMRHALTDFGSGYVGQDNNSYDRTLKFLAGAGLVYGAHKYALANYADYAEGLYQTLRKIETRSPSELLNTFSLSQLVSGYRVKEVRLAPEQLFFAGGLTQTGEHLQRLIGINPLEERFRGGMTFKQANQWSPYLALEGAEGYAVRFAERGRLTASSARYGGPLSEMLPTRSLTDGGPFAQLSEWFKNVQSSQYPRSPLTKKQAFRQAVGGEEFFFHPLYGRRPGVLGELQGIAGQAERVAFEAAERPLRMFANIGLGLPAGSYNKLFHVPFIGQGGLLNKLLVNRVLPAYGAVTLARYINYKLENKPAEEIASLPLKAKVAWAEATDKIPGLRAVTDKYEEIVPGPQYGPLALPIGAGAIGVARNYFDIVRGEAKFVARGARTAAARAAFRGGAKWGLLAMLPFVPGMIGSRQTADELRRIYSGEEEVPVRAGRWWDVGSTPFSGGRIKYFRPHWFVEMQAKSELVATYGSEDAYWEHHPLLHPFKYIKDPYWLERANYTRRPYPITSPAFSNVPLVGPALAATIGRIIKPPVRMHERDWDVNNYTLYSPRLEPAMELGGLPAAKPREEFSFKDVVTREATSFAEFTGLPGFLASTLYGAAGPQGTPGTDVILQGSRQMTSWSKAYYQRELGALSGINPSDTGGAPFGYSEPLRRFIQPEKLQVQANEIPNDMPRWLPGEDYMINFRTGDPFSKIPEGGSRLPGEGYAALHPELQGLRPEQYPAFYRYKILADIAPYSKEYMIYKSQIRAMAQKDTGLQIQFDRIEDQVRQIKESTVQFDQRRFTAPVENIEGTIENATRNGIALREYPGRTFSFSSLGLSAADLSAIALGEQNDLNRTETTREVDRRSRALGEYLQGLEGNKATLVVPKGAEEHATEARAVIFVNDVNVNKDIVDRGLGSFRKENGGAEAQAMYSSVAQSLGKYAETLAFTGEGGVTRFIPTPFHTKYWNERTALALYNEQEVYGSRMRRWQRPFHDMVAPWARGLYRRLTGENLIPEEVQYRRELDSAVDELDYLRGYIQASQHPDSRGRYTSQGKRTNIGANLFGSEQFVATTLPRREKLYFQAFLQETDPDKRQQILQSVSPELARALTAQWVKKDVMIARAEGKEIPAYEQGGVLYTQKGLDEYSQAQTDLSYADYMRSKSIAETFGKLGFNVPGPGSPLWSEGMDYEDVKLKIIQNEGYDFHDFNIYDDRAAILWRKPYVDGAVRELTSGGGGNTERIRQTVENIILEGSDKYPGVTATGGPSRVGGSNVQIDVDEDGTEAIMTDIRRNPDAYRSEATE